MLSDQCQAFFEKVAKDPSLAKALNAESADPVAIAKAAGFDITEQEIKELKEWKESELSIDQLEGVAGGGEGGGTTWCCCACCSCNSDAPVD